MKEKVEHQWHYLAVLIIFARLMHLQALQLSIHNKPKGIFQVSQVSCKRIDPLVHSLLLFPTVPARVGPGRAREPPWSVAPFQEEEPRVSGGHTHLAILVSTAAVCCSLVLMRLKK